MDRLDEWRVFVAVAASKSFAKTARSLGRSPQAITRAVAALEERLGTRLLNRTTRSVSLTHDGERYLEPGRRALAEFDRLEAQPDTEAALTGRLSITAPVLFGQLHVLPIVTEFLALHDALDVRLLLHDRVVSLAEEGVDLGLRIGALPDSALLARSIGQVHSVLCASPAYLARAGVPDSVDDLAGHDCIAFTGTSSIPDRWLFPVGGKREHAVNVRARLVVNTGQAAIDAALAGLGIARVLSYQVAALVARKRLVVVLSIERDALPVQLVHLPGLQTRPAAAFLDFAARRLRERLRRLSDSAPGAQRS
jgi:DNA-binding transcriptional LysR family regulator